VAASALVHVMVTTDTRDAAHGYAYACYDCTARPMRQVHLILGPQNFLPTPGGFLHVMWQDAEIRRGTPEQVAATAPALGLGLPDVVIDAVPYLRWSKDTVRVRTGQRYRVILNNTDPVSWHAWHFHGKVAAGGHGEGDEGGGDEGGSKGGHAHGGHAHGSQEGDAAMDGEARVGSTVIPQAHGQPQLLIPMPEASQWVTTIEFDEPGTYEYGCPVMNHEKRGMKGVFVVDGPTIKHEMKHDAPGRAATHGSAKGGR
ncbi:MAG: multicopper oxidase domain-containing protein, partial [Candidatus Eremiobacteraeota bacterium]|nr:multicopper oxidase domain-containing protein [Candidatus Eremiobacteraeota bacterium]